MVNNREDVPVWTGPTLDDGGDVDGGETPGRAYSSVQCLALLSCCFLFLTYSVAIDGTVGVITIWMSEKSRDSCRYGWDALPSGSSDGCPRVGSLGQETGR